MPVLAFTRRHPTATDTAVAILFSVVALVSVHAALEAFKGNPGFTPAGDPALVVAVLATTLPLALRRRFPLSTATVVMSAFILGRLAFPLEFEEPYVSLWAVYLSLYSAVRFSQPRRRSIVVIAALTIAAVGEIVREVLLTKDLPTGLPLTRWFLFFYNLAILALPLILGLAVRSSSERQRKLAAQAVELQRERQENARRAVLEERVRIARELHDVVAHHVSVMGIQAGAARRVVESRPEKVEEVLGMIEASSRDAVVELHRLLGFLRRAGETDGIAPQPDLGQVSDLVARAGGADLDVDLVVAGDRRPLPPTVELSAYRVIQEALTNTLKHSGAQRATVHVGYGATVLEVSVRDDGEATRVRTNGTPAGGHGLIGMRERVRLHGGHLRTGTEPNGGFSVHATFPLEDQSA